MKQDLFNKYEMANRTIKVNRMLDTIEGHPHVTDAIREGRLSPTEWDTIAIAANVIPAGVGTRHAIRTILRARELVNA